MELVGENFLSYISCIRNLVRVRYLQNPGKLFADSMKILLILLLIGMSISWTVSYVQMFRWSHGNTVALKKGEPLPKLDFKRIIKCKKHILLSDVISDTGGCGIGVSIFCESADHLYAFFSSHVIHRPFCKKMGKEKWQWR